MLGEKALRKLAAKKTALTFRVLYMADNPLYILTPKKRLIRYLCVIFLVWTALLSLTFTFKSALIVTPPFIVLTGYVFFLFSRVWRSYKYSPVYTVSLFILSFPVASLCRYLAYIFLHG